MKTLCSFPVNRTLFLAVLCSLLFASTSAGRASAEDHLTEALSTARAWVAEIDAGQYEESYLTGSSALHDKTPEKTWVLVLKTLRAPRGPVVNRKQTSHIYKSNGFEGAEGEFMVITYDTSFAKSDPATEVVVLKWENGKWLGAGYNAETRPMEQASGPSDQNAQTETSTVTTKKPPQ